MSLSAVAYAPNAGKPVKSSLRQAVIAALASLQCAVPAALLALATHDAGANPVGEKVVAGAATFDRSGNALTVTQGSHRAIINWQGFSIGAGELTKFVQPNAGSAVLNRVVSGNPSALLGRLEANGNVFLINPNGILVGGGAVINTNSFVASTRDVPNAQFMAGGDLNFVGSSTAGITNLGKINATGGDVFLIAHSVENAGTITAPQGVAGLAAGSDVILKHAGDERLFVRTSVPATSGGVDNSGLVAAVQAELKAASGNVYGLAVNNSGAVHATGIVEKDGRVLLTAARGDVVHSGTVTARNADGSGGAATITGERVALRGNALVDVSGEGGGGTALIGGDFQGRNPDVMNAQHTRVGRDARIHADAVGAGDGGKVIVWADQSTVFNGHISARGAGAGDGGFAEVSGKQTLGFTGSVDLSAPYGTTGTLLLDPKNVRIQTPGATAAVTDVDEFSDNAGGDETISPAVLQAANASILIRANNDIDVNEAVLLTAAGASFTAEAGRTIRFDATGSVTTNGGAVNLTANETAGVDLANRDAGPGVVSMHSLSFINSNGGNVTVRAKTNPSDTGAQFLTISRINAGAGTINLTNDGADNGAGALSGSIIANELIASRVEVGAPGQILLTGPTNAFGTLVVNGNHQLNVVNSGALTVGDNGVGGPTIGLGNVSIQTTGGGDLTLDAPLTQPGSITNAGGTTVTFNAAGSLFLNGHVNAMFTAIKPDMTFTAGNDITVNAGAILGRNLTFTATNGNIVLNIPANELGIVAADINPHGLVTFNAGINIIGNGNATITARNLSLNATNGSISLPGFVNAVRLDATAAGDIAIDRASDNQIATLGDITGGGDITILDLSAAATGLSIAGVTRSNAPNGRVTVRTKGSAQFVPGSGRIETGAGGVMEFEAVEGQILDGTTPSFIGDGLIVKGRAIGGGTTNPLNTQVNRLEAQATRSNNFGGFIFIANNENAAGTLGIGGLSMGSLGVLADGRNSSFEAIHLVNNGTVTLDQGGIFGSNNNRDAGAVTVIAEGASSDFMTSIGLFGTAVLSDRRVNISAGRDVLVGAGTTAGSLVSRGTHNVEAGRDVVIEGPQIFTDSGDLTTVNAARAIRVIPALDSSGGFRSTNGRIELKAPTIDLNNGSATNPVIRTNESGAGGSVALNGDEVNIGGRIDAGTGPVSIAPQSSNRPTSIGSEQAGSLSLTDEELDRIKASIVSIGGFASTAAMTVNAPITRPTGAFTYDKLELLNSGDIAVNSNVDMGSGGFDALALSGAIRGTGEIHAGTVTLFSSTASIDFAGEVHATSLALTAPGGDVLVDNDNNEIGTLTGGLFDREFRLLDRTGGLVVSGNVDGGATSFGRIETRGGNLVFQAGSKLFFGGSNQVFRLFSDTGFVNLVGADVFVPENGGRWVLYSPSPDVTQLNGLSAPFTFFSLNYPELPATSGNTIVYSSAQPGTTPTGPEPPAQLNFRLFQSTSELPIVRELLNRVSEVGRDTKFDFRDQQRSLVAIDIFGDFMKFRDEQYDGAVAKIQALPMSKAARDRANSLITVIDYNIADFNRLYTEFLQGEKTVAELKERYGTNIAEIMKDTLNYLAALEGLYQEVSGLQAARALIADAERFADGKIVADDNGVPIIVPGGDFSHGGPPLNMNQILNIVNASGFNVSLTEATRIVAAGGGNLNPGVIAGLVAAGGGNLSGDQINGMVAAGGGNLRNNPVALTSVINATLVAAGAGNLVAAGAGNLVAAGGGNLSNVNVGNLIGMDGSTLVAAGGLNLVAAGGLNLIGMDGGSLVAAGGGNLVAAGGGNLVAAGGLNFTSVVSNLVAAGGLNLVAAGAGNIISSGLVAAGGLNLIGMDGGSLVAAGGLNFTSIAAGLVAAGGGNITSQTAAGIVAAGGGNLNTTVSQLVAAGAGNMQPLASLVAAGGGNLVAAGGLNLVAAGGGNLVAAGGGNIQGLVNGSTFMNPGQLLAPGAMMNPGAMIKPGGMIDAGAQLRPGAGFGIK